MSENSTPLSREFSRRKMLRSIAVALTAAGSSGITLEAGRLVHLLAQEEREPDGSYQPLFFKNHEFQTVMRLTELIIPADGTSGSALEAGAPEFIDLLCSQNQELARMFSGGLLWLDGEMSRRQRRPFVSSDEPQQHLLMTALAQEARHQEERERASRNAGHRVHPSDRGFLQYTAEPASELGPGGQFFVWVRRLTVDAFYTSRIGVADIDYQGNSFWESYRVPQEAIDYALRRSKDQ